MANSKRNLPLTGVKVVEFAGLAPGPLAGMVLADFGADVVRIDRPAIADPRSVPAPDVLARGKRSIAVDTKTRSGHALVRKLIEQADVLIDPFRPGVLERMKLGPEIFLGDGKTQESGRNRKLVYARLVGFPRSGPHKDMAGHDLNYLAISGVLSMMPGQGKPEFPLNILGDFAGGGIMCAMGIMLALLERNNSGLGQIVNTDMVSGTRYLSSFPLLLRQIGTVHFGESRETGLLDGGSPYYNVYTCADDRWMSVACVEPQFYRIFVERLLGVLPTSFALEDGYRISVDDQFNFDCWPRMREFLERAFKLHPRDYWENVYRGSDACVVPVLSVQEAATLEANTSNGGQVPLPHPDLGRTPAFIDPQLQSSDLSESMMLVRGAHTEEILSELGVSAEDRAALFAEGAFGGRATGAKL